MKNLILVRHAKSSWDYGVDDKDRPLKESGINDAKLVAAKIAWDNINVDAVYTSPANRALHTCMIFMRKLNFSFKMLQVENALYDFSGESVHQFIKELPDNLETVMVFGHNSAFTNIANSLGNIQIENITTSGYVHIAFNVNEWSTLVAGTTEQILFPKQIR